MTVIVGVDLSLTSTGIARIEAVQAVLPAYPAEDPPRTVPGHRVNIARVQSKPPPTSRVTLASRSLRLRKIAGEVFGYCTGADLVVIEGPSYASDSGAAHDRAGLWWMVVGRLTGQGYNVVEVPPTVLKTYATGKGNAPKDAVLAAVVRRYPQVDVDQNDVADALVLAAMGARFIGQPIEPDLPQTHTRALARVKWTPNR